MDTASIECGGFAHARRSTPVLRRAIGQSSRNLQAVRTEENRPQSHGLVTSDPVFLVQHALRQRKPNAADTPQTLVPDALVKRVGATTSEGASHSLVATAAMPRPAAVPMNSETPAELSFLS